MGTEAELEERGGRRDLIRAYTFLVLNGVVRTFGKKINSFFCFFDFG